MKKALIILAEGFEEIEAVTPIDILRRAGVEVTVAGLNSREIKGARGIVIQTDMLLAEVIGEFDACVLPGGMPGASNLADSPDVRELLVSMHALGKIIAAICAAPAVVLAPLGILDHKTATCFPGREKEFAGSTTLSLAPVVTDDNLITSRAAGTAMEFALTLAEKLAGKEKRDAIARAVLAE